MLTRLSSATALLLCLAAAPLLADPDAEPEAAPSAPVKSLSGSRPNIIFIFSDDHTTQAIGAYGAKLGVDVTPRMDRMAAEGTRFDGCFCNNALCGPSRAAVLTGKFSHANGYSQNEGQKPFDGSQPTLPKYLRRAGYQTAMYGKWHLDSDPTGFDDWKVLVGQGIYYNPVFITPKGKVKVPGYVSDVTTDMALEWLDRRDTKKPFLLMLHQKAPHRHWLPGPEEAGLWKGHKFPEPDTLFDDYSGRGTAAAKQEMQVGRDLLPAYDLHIGTPDRPTSFTMATKAGVVDESVTPAQRKPIEAAWDDENLAFLKNPPKGRELTQWKYQRYMMEYLRTAKGVDRNIGRVLDYLKEKGLDENTLVVYSSDQGFFLGEHGWFDKRWIYEESVRMPLIMRWPGHLTPKSTCAATVQNTDFMPTFLDLAGVKRPDDIHGESFVPVLEGRSTAVHDAAYYHYYEKAEHNVPRQTGIRTPRYTLVWFYDEKVPYWELFDREKDPQQLKSVYDSPVYAKVREELTAQLKALAAKYHDDTPPWGTAKPRPTGTME